MAARVGLGHRVDRARQLLQRLLHEKPLLVVLALGVAGLLAGPGIDVLAELLRINLRLSKAGFVAVGFGLVLLLFAAALLIRSAPARQTAPPLPPDTISVRNVFSVSELHQLRHGLHQDLYGGVAPNGDEIDRMYRKNPRIGVGLYDRTLDDFVGFAAAWPIRSEAARKIIAGEMDENALTAEDILPAAENAAAEYVLIPAFGTALQRRAELGRDLFFELRGAIRRNYLSQPGRALTLVATGFSSDGQRWCERMGMTPVCHVKMDNPDDEECPIYVRTVTSEDFA